MDKFNYSVQSTAGPHVGMQRNVKLVNSLSEYHRLLRGEMWTERSLKQGGPCILQAVLRSTGDRGNNTSCDY